jgi:predicted HTH transcriptional regulator
MSSSPSNAEQFFKDIQNRGNDFIDEVISQRMNECEWLDFKRKGDEASNQRNFSKALSAFSNSGGGVVLWGIDARESKGIDGALDKFPFEEPRQFESTLRKWAPNFVSPPVEVKYFTFLDTTQPDRGYVACFIPDGEFKPYRAELKTYRNYFQRAGDSFEIINRSMLQHMFFPFTKIAFEIDCLLKYKVEDDKAVCDLESHITNVGSVSASQLVVNAFFSSQPESRIEALHPWKDVGSAFRDFGRRLELTKSLHP